MSLMETFDLAGSTLATFSRFGRGIYTRPASLKPERPLEVYDIENCPYCRLVREVLTELDLEAMIYPCPKGGRRHRPRAIELGGRSLFPFLVDPNTGRHLYESADIALYLFETYGQRPLPRGWRLRSANVLSSGVASAYRGRAGARVKPSRPPDEPLELYSFESSPFARRVREVLCELELPYLLHNVGRTQASESLPPGLRDRLGLGVTAESASRQAFEARAGRVLVPYLVDPNTEVAMFESGAICRYLRATYGAAGQEAR
jgi:glutathione S-transferase